jgi:hypothetical protein
MCEIHRARTGAQFNQMSRIADWHEPCTRAVGRAVPARRQRSN